MYDPVKHKLVGIPTDVDTISLMKSSNFIVMTPTTFLTLLLPTGLSNRIN